MVKMLTPNSGRRRIRADYAFFIVAISLAIFPLGVRDAYLLNILILAMIFSVLAASWNVISGYAGMFTFGHHAFFGIGAYVSAILSIKMGVSPWLGLLVGGCAAVPISFVIGLPCLRLRAAPYIALATLAFAEITRVVCANLVDLTRGEMGLWGIPHFPSIAIPGIGVISFAGGARIPYYYLILAILIITMLFIYVGSRSSVGVALRAMGDSQDAAESLGINITWYKLLAFMASAFFAGVVGSFYAHYVLILTPSSILHISIMVDITVFTFLGGRATLMGPVIGSLLLYIGLEQLRVLGEYRLIVYGILLVVIIVFMPRGVGPRFIREKSITE